MGADREVENRVIGSPGHRVIGKAKKKRREFAQKNTI
jgi:hypothetical protein